MNELRTEKKVNLEILDEELKLEVDDYIKRNTINDI